VVWSLARHGCLLQTVDILWKFVWKKCLWKPYLEKYFKIYFHIPYLS
jgi:hypothetical protein